MPFGGDIQVPSVGGVTSGWVLTTNGTSVFWAAGGGGGGGDPTALKILNNLSDVNSASTSRVNLGLGNVENTALSTWAGSSNLTTIGTLIAGTVPVARITGLATVATSGQYADLSGRPTLPSGEIVGTTDTQILSNKTLTAPIISSIVNTGTLTLPTTTGTLALTSQIPSALALYAENASSPITPLATGVNSVAIGSNSSVATDLSTVVGSSTRSNVRSLAFVAGASSGAARSADATNSSGSGTQRGISIGVTDNATALGANLNTSSSAGIAIGVNNGTTTGATVTGNFGTAIGMGSSVSSVNGVAIGVSNAVTGGGGVAVGNGCSSQGGLVAGGNCFVSSNGVSLGSFSSASGIPAVAIGQDSTASGVSSVALGNRGFSNRVGQFTFGSGQISSNGDALTSLYTIRTTTASTTPTLLNPDGGTANRMILATGMSQTFTIRVVGRDTSNGDTFSALYYGAIKNVSTTVSLVGAIQQVGTIISDASLSTTTVAITADNTNKALAVTITSPVTNSCRWVATVELTQVN